MPRAKERLERLNLDRDLPTTDVDVEALRRAREMRALGSFLDLDWLTPGTLGRGLTRRHSAFPQQTPFKLSP